MRITFKNVGQGDSIILEWSKRDDTVGIGIVDCNLYNGENPVLLHIQRLACSYIDFIILSHPHYDHFSGMLELLEFCEDNRIGIGCFYHTCHQHPDYIKAAYKSATTQKELGHLLLKVQSLFRKEKIRKQALSQFVEPIPLEEKVSMKCLSPSEREYDDFISSKTYKYSEEEHGNIAKANKLSTLLKIQGSGWYILLTSDTELSTFKRLAKQHSDEFKDNLLLAQSPHHGAWTNHWSEFWKRRTKAKGAFAVISVGKNRYEHPSQKTVDSFIENQYQLRYTSAIGVLRNLERSEQAQKNTIALDVFASLVVEQGKDCVFEIQNGSIAEPPH